MDKNKSIQVVKIGILGDSEVGKTAICNSFFNIEFTEDMLATIGSEKLEKKIKLKNDEEIKLVLYDTPGTERFRHIAFMGTRNADGIILVFDLLKKITFEHLDSWLQDIKDHFIILPLFYLVIEQI